MRIMLDTNVLISMVFFPGKRFADMLEYITREHTLVLSSFVVEELAAVAERKFPSKRDLIDRFLFQLGYELVYTPHKMEGGLFKIRDVNLPAAKATGLLGACPEAGPPRSLWRRFTFASLPRDDFAGSKASSGGLARDSAFIHGQGAIV